MIALKKLYLNVGILTESLINKPKKYKMKNTKTGNSLLFRIIKSAPLFIILLQSTFLFSQNDDNINSRDILYLTSGGKLIPQQAIMDIRTCSSPLSCMYFSISLKTLTCCCTGVVL
jgi:hypothetical protein